MKNPAAILFFLVSLATPGIASEETAESHLDRGASLLYQGNYEAARKEFEQALKLDPGYLKARVNLATAYYRLERFKDAERELVYCIRKDPSYLNARFNLAIVYQAERKLDEALASYRMAAESDQLRPSALRQVGRLQESQGDLEAAKGTYEQSLRADPNQRGAAAIRRRIESLEVTLVKKRIEKGAAPHPPGEVAEVTHEQKEATSTAPLARPEEVRSSQTSSYETTPHPAAPTAAPPAAPSDSTNPPVGEADHGIDRGNSSTPEAPAPPKEAPAATPIATPGATPSATPVQTAAANAESERTQVPPPATPSETQAVPATKPAEDPAALVALLRKDIEEREADTTIFVSMPLGARVYLRKESIRVRDPFVKYGPFLVDKRRRDYLALVSDLVDDKNHRGRTPVVLHLEPGSYEVAFKLEGKEDDYQRDGNTYFRTPALLPDQGLLRSDTKVYELRIEQGRAPAWLTALFIPRNGLTDPLPIGGAFPLSVETLKSDLAPFHPDEAAVMIAIDQLHGFGKALLDTKSVLLLITLAPDGRPEVTRLHR